MEERERQDAARQARRDVLTRSGSTWRDEVLCGFLAAASYRYKGKGTETSDDNGREHADRGRR
jgi:hypothetical protein